MRSGRKVKHARLAFDTRDDVFAVVLAHRHLRQRQVGDAQERVAQGWFYLRQALLQGFDAIGQLGQFRLQGLGRVTISLAQQLANTAAVGIAPRAQVL